MREEGREPDPEIDIGIDSAAPKNAGQGEAVGNAQGLGRQEEATVGEAARIMDERNIGGVPITQNGKLKGILTRRDLRFLESREKRVSEVMTKDNLVTAPSSSTLPWQSVAAAAVGPRHAWADIATWHQTKAKRHSQTKRWAWAVI